MNIVVYLCLGIDGPEFPPRSLSYRLDTPLTIPFTSIRVDYHSGSIKIEMADPNLQEIHDFLVGLARQAAGMIISANPATVDTKKNCMLQPIVISL